MSATEPVPATDAEASAGRAAADRAPADPYTAVQAAPTFARNSPGRASLIVAAAIVLIGLLQQGFITFIPSILNDFSLSIAVVNGALIMVSIVTGILAIVALALGWYALTRPGLPKAAAGAGTAIGASTLLGVLVTFATQLVAYAF